MQTPRRNAKADFLTVNQVMQNLNLSRNSVMKLAVQTDSIYRFGRAIRINAKKLETALVDYKEV